MPNNLAVMSLVGLVSALVGGIIGFVGARNIQNPTSQNVGAPVQSAQVDHAKQAGSVQSMTAPSLTATSNSLEPPTSSVTSSPTARSSSMQVLDAGTPPSVEAQPASNWTYHSTSDPMNDKQTKTACTTSLNEIVQSFPYHDTSARLCIRQSPKFGLDTFVVLDGDGQILCGIDACQIAIRFDKEFVQHFPAVEAADHSTNIIFINRTSRLVAKLKKASTTAVELTLYQNGDQSLTFNTAGLKWP